jgi:hypothetical protein
MATILLSAAGAAIGSGFGGTVLGLSGAVIGRAVGATLGRVIDQRLLGSGSEAVEVGRVDRFRIMAASEGAGLAQVYGRVRIAGQVIWATRFQETTTTSGGGKGSPPEPEVTELSYSVSLAIALCEGQVQSVGRIWADGEEIELSSINMRVYRGGEQQQPDPKIEAVEGVGKAPAYRGIAYLVIEDLALGRFGNRVPQFSFEVVRPTRGSVADTVTDIRSSIKGVALIPGTGEYALATSRVHYSDDPGVNRSANVNSPLGGTDFAASLRQLDDELPDCGSVSLVVSWFGDDLRCGQCEVRPKVEQVALDGEGMPWRAGGIARDAAQEVPKSEGRSIYGGTPADASVIEAIRALRAKGKKVTFYPFILMEQLAGNDKPDPWSGAANQAALPWRGRITTSTAPGRAGSPDGTAQAATQVSDFFGSAAPSDFGVNGGVISYSGPAEWRYRRFILHYANLCLLAGGVDAFCIGSEMVALTQIRGAGDTFPAVTRLRQLAEDVRTVLGTGTKIGYAADWSEYFGYQTGNNVYFHLDPLWAHPDIDFIGIDNYMPLSDWRESDEQTDEAFGSVYNLEYLKANIAGGEGFDWYYDSPEGAAAQKRTPITDGAFGEPWVFRYKDIKNWWSQPHHNRIDGVRAAAPTDWVPGSKPIWFTEYGCPAIDKGTNQPNKFVDPKSSESQLPVYSNGRRDDLIQMQYLRAMAEYWGDPAANPEAALYTGRMVDMGRAHVWAWDARPFPYFPNAMDVWTDGDNYARGHWLTGRATNQALASVVAEICERSGVTAYDVTELYGIVRGYWREDVEPARAALQPLMLAYGFDVAERDGMLRFAMRNGRAKAALVHATLAVSGDVEGAQETERAADAEMAGRVRLGFVEAEGDYELRQTEAIFPDDQSPGVSQSEFPLVLTRAEARAIAERWLTEARIARDTTRFALPPSQRALGAGDVVSLAGADYRIDRLESGEAQVVDAVRVERGVYRASDASDARIRPRKFVAAVPTHPVFLDLPLLTGEEAPHAPHLAISARPWPGVVACWSSVGDADIRLNRRIDLAATMGRTQTVLSAARAGLWDRGPSLRVRLFSGNLSSASEAAILDGANPMAIGDGSNDTWEVFQFAEATLVAPRTYELSLRLRGQLGSDGLMPAVWPVGSQVVLLNDALKQLRVAPQARGLDRTYRVGIAARGYNDPAVVKRILAFEGNGSRPYAPAHLSAVPQSGGGLAISWVRRTRINGDSWNAANVPLGEVTESYLLRVIDGAVVRREVTLAAPNWTYSATARLADGIFGGYRIEVAQISESYGPGLFRSILIT